MHIRVHNSIRLEPERGRPRSVVVPLRPDLSLSARHVEDGRRIGRVRLTRPCHRRPCRLDDEHVVIDSEREPHGHPSPPTRSPGTWPRSPARGWARCTAARRWGTSTPTQGRSLAHLHELHVHAVPSRPRRRSRETAGELVRLIPPAGLVARSTAPATRPPRARPRLAMLLPGGGLLARWASCRCRAAHWSSSIPLG